MIKKKVPMRICVGCNEAKSKKELIRVVITPEEEIRIDRTGKAPGRGAYICPSQECLDAAYKAKRLERSLKHAVNPAIYETLKADLGNE